MKQIYIITKLFNVHDRLSSLYLSDKIDEWIKSGKLQEFKKCFLPYRDSNEKVKGKENQTFEIFKMDCATMRESALIIGYFDGPNYDSGIGFEIGYAYVLNKPIILLSSDYFEIALSSDTNMRHSISALTTSIANIIHIKDSNNHNDNYGKNLLSFREELNKQLLMLLESEQYEKTNTKDNNNVCREATFDILIDYNFTKTESSRLVLKQIISRLCSQGITYYIATDDDYECATRIFYKLQCTKNILIYGDSCFDLGVDSAIIQGMAFALSKKVILFSSENICLYQSDKFILYKNPMIEHSAKTVCSIADLMEELI
ncbi:MAG: nucleoside 2-deoxyribosyltransferase [Oscillospiraceae bacterium]|nr:nucleoside 2-deoxyribosyltransferase [Oscillospiraceae bacterium]